MPFKFQEQIDLSLVLQYLVFNKVTVDAKLNEFVNVYTQIRLT